MFKPPRLVQRLNITRSPGKLNPFTFGGGYTNGGLTDEAAKDLSNVFTFEYMGSAEYEWGAVPKAIASLWEQGQKEELEAWQFEFPTKNLALSSYAHPEDYIPPESKSLTAYVIAPKAFKKDVDDFILLAAKGQDKTKDSCVLLWRAYTRLKNREVHTRLGGWLALDSAFMFFSDKTMWEGMQQRLMGAPKKA